MIKKIILITFMCFFIIGCNDNNYDNFNSHYDDGENLEVDNDFASEEDVYIDDNPIKIALYDKGNKITTYSTKLTNFTDIGVFDVCYTDADKLDNSNIKYSYPKCYSQYENIDNYKTGFYITFEANGEKLEELVLDPSSQYNMNPYLYIYLYDDVNQADWTYYSHLTMNDMNEKTIFSSIKLFLGEELEKITSPITLTVFTYDGDEDFDENNRYRGVSSYTVIIETK